MESVSWMSDYFPVTLLSLAQQEERRFEECLLECPREDDAIKVLDRKHLGRLLQHRTTSVLLGLAALEAYLGYYANQAAGKIEAENPGVKLGQFLEQQKLTEFFKELPNRWKRRHQLILEEYGEKPLSQFLTRSSLHLEEKLLYWPAINTGKFISFKNAYLKKALRINGLREDLLHYNLETASELIPVKDRREMEKALLYYELPERLTPGRSCADEMVVEAYDEHNFIWELLHCYPARMVQEMIQYLHSLDESENHFITAIAAIEISGENGKPLTEPMKQYQLVLNLEE